jgi:glyoxylase-like metal-dependent hydrolase (beta-lactamase superfamily II)
VCDEDRESITHQPQAWTSLAESDGKYRNVFSDLGDGVFGIKTEPHFGIGQEIYFIRTPAGNILWDCLGFVDRRTSEQLTELGGLAAIVISHPHFIGSMNAWSLYAGGIPVHIHADNTPWIPEVGPNLRLWDGDQCEIVPSLTAIHCGGHFPGSCILHWSEGANGRGALFTSDTILPVEDRRWVSFMYSYPNLIPLSARSVNRIAAAVEPISFDRIYGGPMYGTGGARPIIKSGAKAAVTRSALRYLAHLSDFERAG